MSPQTFGALALLGSAALVAVAAGVALFGLARGDRRLGTRAGLAAFFLVVLYGAALLVSPSTARPTVLPPGEEISFCGFDCHLHVSYLGDARILVRPTRVCRSGLAMPSGLRNFRQLRFRLVMGRIAVRAEEGRIASRPTGRRRIGTVS
jgi:hypothetical protein